MCGIRVPFPNASHRTQDNTGLGTVEPRSRGNEDPFLGRPTIRLCVGGRPWLLQHPVKHRADRPFNLQGAHGKAHMSISYYLHIPNQPFFLQDVSIQAHITVVYSLHIPIPHFRQIQHHIRQATRSPGAETRWLPADGCNTYRDVLGCIGRAAGWLVGVEAAGGDGAGGEQRSETVDCGVASDVLSLLTKNLPPPSRYLLVSGTAAALLRPAGLDRA